MINSKKFGKYIKIGIQTKGYEKVNCGNNLLVCVDFIGKLATNSSSRFKIKIDDAVGIMGNKGIKLMNLLKINSEEYAGRECNLEKLCKKEILRPNDHLTYTNTKGETSIRFTDYKYTDKKEIDEELEDNESTINMEGMSIQNINEEDYEVDLSITKAKELHQQNKILFKCKGCKLKKNMD